MDFDLSSESSDELTFDLTNPDYLHSYLEEHILFDRVVVPLIGDQDFYLQIWDDKLDKFCLLCPTLVETVVAITNLSITNLDFEIDSDSFSHLYNRLKESGHHIDILSSVFRDEVLHVEPNFIKAWLLSVWSRAKYCYWVINANACHRCAFDYQGQYNRESAFGVVSLEDK